MLVARPAASVGAISLPVCTGSRPTGFAPSAPPSHAPPTLPAARVYGVIAAAGVIAGREPRALPMYAPVAAAPCGMASFRIVSRLIGTCPRSRVAPGEFWSKRNTLRFASRNCLASSAHFFRVST